MNNQSDMINGKAVCNNLRWLINYRLMPQTFGCIGWGIKRRAEKATATTKPNRTDIYHIASIFSSDRVDIDSTSLSHAVLGLPFTTFIKLSYNLYSLPISIYRMSYISIYCDKDVKQQKQSIKSSVLCKTGDN